MSFDQEYRKSERGLEKLVDKIYVTVWSANVTEVDEVIRCSASEERELEGECDCKLLDSIGWV